MSDQSIEEQLMQLKEMTRRTGVISEAQCLQIRYSAILAVQHAKDTPDIGFDWENKVLEVYFRKLNKKKAEKDLAEKLEVFCKHMHWLLGDEYTVRVKDGNTVIGRLGGVK